MAKNDRKTILAVAAVGGIGLAAFGIIKAVSGAEPPPPPPGKANVYGKVRDSVTAAAVSGVTVLVGGYQTATDGSGNYLVENINPGNYSILFEKLGYLQEEIMATLVEGNNVLDVVMTPLVGAGDPQILSLTIPTATPGGQFWPEATLKLPQADAYRMDFSVDPQVFYPQSGAVPIMGFQFAASIPDPASPSGLVTIPLDRPDNTYNLRGQRFNAKSTYTYDQGLYNAMMAAEAASQAAYQASQAAWDNVAAVWEAIMASWPEGWEDDPNWQYTHPAYSYPEWRDAQAAAETATSAYDAASRAHEAAQAAFYASEVRTYTRELWPAQAFVYGLLSYNLPPGNWPVIGSIFKTVGGHETEFNFGEIGTLRVI